MGPTPWVRTSQPSGVSMGEPQLPIWIRSHESSGLWIVVGRLHRQRSSDVATEIDSRSQRDRAT